MRAVIIAFSIALSSCATAPPADGGAPAGIRREPCGGGPIFPPETSETQRGDETVPAPQDKKSG